MAQSIDTKPGTRGKPRPRPLTRRTVGGKKYGRRPEIEDQIREVLFLDPSSLVERAGMHDREAPAFLKEETLVYLIREYRVRKDDAIAGALCEILFRRCGGHIRGKLQSLDRNLADEAYAEVVGSIAESILDTTTDQGDFLQVSFWWAVRRRAISAYRKYHAEQVKRGNDTVPDEDGEEFPEPKKDAQESSMSEEDRYLYREGLRILPEHQRVAYVLRYYEGWQIESDDPDEPTISGYFKRTPRMIRNWFEQAEKTLHRWSEGKGRK